MDSSGMLRRVALVRTEVLEALSSCETSVLTRTTLRNIPEDAILHSHPRENLKSYTTLNLPAIHCCQPLLTRDVILRSLQHCHQLVGSVSCEEGMWSNSRNSFGVYKLRKEVTTIISGVKPRD
jgi:hypothetical protein